MMTIFALMISLAQADEWFCTQESSKVVGQSIHACGLAHGSTEDEARSKALNSAKDEYMKLCSMSDFCRTHETAIDPQRTSCEKKDDWQCYRLVIFTSTREISKAKQAVQNIVNKIRKGMSKLELFRIFGMPKIVAKVPNYNGREIKSLYYPDHEGCTGMGCHIRIENDVVTGFDNVEASYEDI